MPHFSPRGFQRQLLILTLGASLIGAAIALVLALRLSPTEASYDPAWVLFGVDSFPWIISLATLVLIGLTGLAATALVESRLLGPIRSLVEADQASEPGGGLEPLPRQTPEPRDELNELLAMRARDRRRAQIIESLGQLVMKASEPGRLREQILITLVSLLACDRGSLWELMEEGGYFVGQAETRNPDLSSEAVIGTRLTSSGEALINTLERTGGPVLILDPSDSAYTELLGSGWLAKRSIGPLLAIPLRRLGSLIGFVLLERKEPATPFDTDDLVAAQAGGVFAGLALENSRWQLAERSRGTRMKALAEFAAALTTKHRLAEVFGEVVERGSAMVRSATCSVLVLDEATESLVMVAQAGVSDSSLSVSLPLKNEIVQEFLRLGQPLIIEDIDEQLPELRRLLVRQEVKSIFIFPLQATGRILGALTLGYLVHHRMDEIDLTVSETLASVSAGAIQNAMAFEGEVEQRNLLAAVSEISRRISGILDPEWMLSEVCELLGTELGFDWVHAFLRTDGDDFLLYEAGFGKVGDERGMDGLAIPLDDRSLVGRVAASSSAGRASEDQHDIFRQSDPAFLEVRSELALPITTHNRVVGVLDVQSRNAKAFGADDERLLGIITEQIAVAMDNARHHAQVQAQAQLDSLTQVLNHGAFVATLHALAEKATREELPLSVIMLDVDYFKTYNDQFGHVAGDAALKTTVQAIKANVKSRDAVGRWGGEEFGIALDGATKEQARSVADRIRETLASLRPVDRLGREMPAPTISQGIASLGDDAADADTLVDVADKALYRAKGAGRDQVVVAGEA